MTSNSEQVRPVAGASIDFSVDDGFGVNASSGTGRKVTASTLVFVGVMVASVASLWSMRTLSSSSASVSDGGETVRDVREWVWSRSEGGVSTSSDALGLIGRLDTSQLGEYQVDPSNLRHTHPFQPLGLMDDAASSLGEGGSSEMARARKAWEQSVGTVVEGIKISAIMAPDTPRAQTVLNGIRVMVGDQVEIDQLGNQHSYFVTQITQDGVEFEVIHSNGIDRMETRKNIDRGW